jgi:hypothetical protein
MLCKATEKGAYMPKDGDQAPLGTHAQSSLFSSLSTILTTATTELNHRRPQSLTLPYLLFPFPSCFS